MSGSELPKLARVAHAGHCNRCLSALPSSHIQIDASRLAIGFYCFGTLDLLGSIYEKTKEIEREGWREWLWHQQTSGIHGTGFKPSSYMTQDRPYGTDPEEYSEYDTPHLIMTYTAILSLAILRDDFEQLDRNGIVRFLQACQREDGSFTSFPNGGESDLRQVYCAFAISSMLDDWSGVDVDRAVSFIQQCSSHEGGYGQQPTGEALGGTTYCALASLYLAPSVSDLHAPNPHVTTDERRRTIRWLLQNQASSGGFSGRTNKDADACYCFWCGASLHVSETLWTGPPSSRISPVVNSNLGVLAKPPKIVRIHITPTFHLPRWLSSLWRMQIPVGNFQDLTRCGIRPKTLLTGSDNMSLCIQ
ncbi:unnamed protein product [Somion occarium]|uniref:Prenyltransferase alpha-alpha toroid domain-containing protein n=1 Tax=Somion occarium TaxID=3059160 RepID=A0ABP1E2A8_9APHY